MSVGSRKSESAFIRRLRKELDPATDAGRRRRQSASAPVDFVDDMATLESAPTPLLWTVDMLADGVDFRSAEHGWYDIGRKSMAVNLSDCAAMAAVPIASLCAVSLNNQLSLDDAVALVRGAHDCGLRFGCPVVGGDTNSWDAPTTISITVAARPENGCDPVRRDGARVGDRICLTGPVGGSILGRHMTFCPRVEEARAINRHLRPHAMIDISDGLALDLWRVLEASSCGAILDAAGLDTLIHPDALRLAQQDGRSARDHALYDGEDFELIVVLPSSVAAQDYEALGLRPVGVISEGTELHLREPDGQRVAVERRGWEHFQ